MDLFILRTWLDAKFHAGERDETGANLVEYILLLVFIALVVLVAVQFLGGKVKGKFNSAGSSLG